MVAARIETETDFAPSLPSNREDFAAELLHALPYLQARAWRLENDRDRANDLVQESILRMLERRVQFRPGTNLRHWAGTVMRNLFFDRCRERMRTLELRCLGTQPEWEEPENVASEDEDRPRWENITQAQIERACQQLDDCLRDAAVLVLFEGLSYKSAARRLGVPISTVGTRLHRARERLRPLLSTEPPDAPPSWFRASADPSGTAADPA
jgi:RNA polymerase sigma-70 factor, ECF subfamily